MNITKLSDDALIDLLTDSFIEERELLVCQLRSLAEMERRRLFFHYSSLWQYLTHELGMEETTAIRRIRAARLTAELPGVLPLLESGKLHLSHLDLAERFFQGKNLSADEKLQVFESIQGMSFRSAQKELQSKSTGEPSIPKDQVRVITGDLSQVSFVASDDLLEKLESIRGLLAHSHPQATFGELFSVLADEYLERHHPEQKAKRAQARVEKKQEEKKVKGYEVPAQNRTSTHPFHATLAVESRTPTAAQIRELVHRNGYRCSYQDPKTGKSCHSEYGIEVDHRIPWACGGKTEVQNLRLLCKSHNAREAIRTFGITRIDRLRSKQEL